MILFAFDYVVEEFFINNKYTVIRLIDEYRRIDTNGK